MRSVVIAFFISLVLIIGAVIGYFALKPGSENPNKINITQKPSTNKPLKKKDDIKTKFLNPKNSPGRNIKVIIQVKVKDELNKPISDAIVRIIRQSNIGTGAPDLKPIQVIRTNKKGFAASGRPLSTGSYLFSAAAKGYAPVQLSKTVSEGTNHVFKLELTLSSGLTISGRVFNKENKPLENAHMVVYKEIGTKNGTEFDWLLGLLDRDKLKKPVSEAQTGTNGRYIVGGLERNGVYALKVTAKTYSPGDKAFVKAGSRNIDFYLDRGSILSGQVVSTAKGPIGGASVSAFPKSKGSNLREAIAIQMRGAVDTVLTDGSGQFQFLTLGQGDYTLLASAPGHQDNTEDVSLFTNTDKTVVISLNEGMVFSGKVEGPDGSPVPGAMVKARSQQREPGRASPMNRNSDKQVETDQEGGFLFDNLSAGKYTLLVTHKDFASARIRDIEVPKEGFTLSLGLGGAIGGVVTDQQGNPVEGAQVTVADVGGTQKDAVTDSEGRYQIDGVSVENSRKKTVNVHCDGFARPDSKRVTVQEGKIVEANFTLLLSSRISGKVVDSSDRPVQNVKVLVELIPTKSNPVHRYLGFDHTKEDGSFDIPDVGPATNIRLVAKHNLYLSWESETFDIGSGEDIVVNIKLEVGGSIAGIVVDENNLPLEGVKVQAVAPGESGVKDFLGTSSDTTDSNGRFNNLKGLQPGKYEVIAHKRGWLEGRSEVVELAEGAGISGVKIGLLKGRSVSGIVADMNGQPIPSANVTVVDISSGTRKLNTVSDKDGKWKVAELGNDPVEIDAVAHGFEKKVLKDVPTGKDDVEIVLASMGSIKGVIINVDGNPVGAYSVKPEVVNVEQGYDMPRTRFKTFSNPDGTFEYMDLPPGTYTINVQAPGYKGVKVNGVVVSASQSTDMGSATLLEGGLLTGQVLDDEGRPVSGVEVSVLGGRSRFKHQAGMKSQNIQLTDNAGRFRFEGLKGGTVRVRAAKQGYISKRSDPVNPDRLEGDLIITLGVGGVVVGVVADENGKPVGKENVYLKGAKSQRLPSDSNGRFEFRDLPAGHYTVGTLSFKNPQSNDRVELDLKSGERVEVNLTKVSR